MDQREPRCGGCGEKVGPGTTTWMIRYHPDQPDDRLATSVSLKCGEEPWLTDPGESVAYVALEHCAAGLMLVLTLNRCATRSLHHALGEALAIWQRTEPELAELGGKTDHPEDRSR